MRFLFYKKGNGEKMKYRVKKEMVLMDFLLIHYNRKNVKNYLKYKNVYVNNQNITQFDYLLKVEDTVEIKKEESSDLKILYEDQEFVVINKPSGLLSMSDGKEKEKTAYHLVSEYVKKENKKNKIFIVHRLDRDTSGVLMFCKNEKIRNQLQEQWNKIVKKRGYIALVEGKLKQKQGTIKNYLSESKTQQVYISRQGKLAITHYRQVKTNGKYSLLEVFLDTGRKNQIRVHLSSLGHPIAGDKKYGATSNPIKRMGLHAHIFSFQHPINHKTYQFEAPMPEQFNHIFR